MAERSDSVERGVAVDPRLIKASDTTRLRVTTGRLDLLHELIQKVTAAGRVATARKISVKIVFPYSVTYT